MVRMMTLLLGGSNKVTWHQTPDQTPAKMQPVPILIFFSICIYKGMSSRRKNRDPQFLTNGWDCRKSFVQDYIVLQLQIEQYQNVKSG